MAKRSSKASSKGKSVAGNGDRLPLGDIRHPSAKRRNIPPAKIAAEGTVPVIPKAEYAYNPHLPPVLRFDQHGKPDALPELLAKARTSPLGEEEVRLLAEALRKHEPWLEWTGKREKPGFAVDPVALHIHERISAQAILKVAARQDVNRFLFADPEQEYHEAVQFYRHDVDWANRLILGDSLQVMSSLARREDLAGKVQMIYMDPPYGIKFASNFQPEVGKRDVKDKQEDLTREPEMVRAYRDTWHLGIHSYLSYLRDRLVVARELLTDTGSIFVQINSENADLLRAVLNEVFGRSNFVADVTFRKKSIPLGAKFLETMHDQLLFYAKDKDQLKFRHLYELNDVSQVSSHGPYHMAADGVWRKASIDEFDPQPENGASFYRLFSLLAPSFSAATAVEFGFEGQTWPPPNRGSWVVSPEKLSRLVGASRVQPEGANLSYRLHFADFPYKKRTNLWQDTQVSYEKRYAVQTAPNVVTCPHFLYQAL